jgi:MFS family permease
MTLIDRVRSALPPRGSARYLTLAYFTVSVGMGLYLPASVVYFVRIVGFSSTEVGAGLSIAGLVGVLCGIPIGRLADRIGPREAAVGLSVLLALAVLALTQVRSYWEFPITAGLLAAGQAGGDISLSALIAGVFGPGETIGAAAYARVAFNAGYSVGLLCAGLAIATDNRQAYLLLFFGYAAAAIAACLPLLRLPRVAVTAHARREPKGRTSYPLRDIPYVLLGQISGLTRLGDTILTVGLPLWIVTRTTAPRELATWVIAGNTVMVMLFQVRAAKAATTTAAAATIQRRAFAGLVLACVLLGWSSGIPAWVAVIILIAGAFCLTLGELWGEGAWYSLRYGLTPSHAQGGYGGVFNLGMITPTVIGPFLVVTLTSHLDVIGWLILAGIFLIGLGVSKRTITWVERTAALRTPAGPVLADQISTE